MDSKNFEVLIEGDALIFVHHRAGTDDLQVAGEVVHTQAWEYWTGVCVPLQMQSPCCLRYSLCCMSTSWHRVKLDCLFSPCDSHSNVGGYVVCIFFCTEEVVPMVDLYLKYALEFCPL